VKRTPTKEEEGALTKSGKLLVKSDYLDVTNVKLNIGGSFPLMGELTISDVLVGEYNRANGAKLPRLTQDLVFDHWAYFLNNHVRETV